MHTPSFAERERLDRADWRGVGELMLASARNYLSPWLHIAEVVAAEAADRAAPSAGAHRNAVARGERGLPGEARRPGTRLGAPDTGGTYGNQPDHHGRVDVRQLHKWQRQVFPAGHRADEGPSSATRILRCRPRFHAAAGPRRAAAGGGRADTGVKADGSLEIDRKRVSSVGQLPFVFALPVSETSTAVRACLPPRSPVREQLHRRGVSGHGALLRRVGAAPPNDDDPGGRGRGVTSSARSPTRSAPAASAICEEWPSFPPRSARAPRIALLEAAERELGVDVQPGDAGHDGAAAARHPLLQAAWIYARPDASPTSSACRCTSTRSSCPDQSSTSRRHHNVLARTVPALLRKQQLARPLVTPGRVVERAPARTRARTRLKGRSR